MNIEERKQEIIATIQMLQKNSGKPCHLTGCGIKYNPITRSYEGVCRVKAGYACQISDLARQYNVLNTDAGQLAYEREQAYLIMHAPISEAVE